MAGAGLKVDLKERQTSHDALVRNIKQVGPLITTHNQHYHAVAGVGIVDSRETCREHCA